MPLLASIDIGSNTLRLLIAEVADGRISDAYASRRITRLGHMVSQTGLLQDETMEISLSVLKEFSLKIAEYGTRSFVAVATSALREASNADAFIKRVLDETGIAVEVISGEREAGLNLRGLLNSLPENKLRPPHATLIVDIGGGSSEWILYKNQTVIDMGSLPVGVIKLSQAYMKTDPVSQDNMQVMEDKILAVLKQVEEAVGKHITKDTQIIGTGGTFTTIASLDIGLEEYSREQIHLHTVSIERLGDLGKTLLLLPLAERKKVKGLEPERADLIIPGIHFTISIMRMFEFGRLTVSDYGLLEGALLTLEESGGKGFSKAGQP